MRHVVSSCRRRRVGVHGGGAAPAAARASGDRGGDRHGRAAVIGGVLSEDRYSSYMKLKKESEYHELSYLDKRKRDRAFGRFIKSAKKQMKV